MFKQGIRSIFREARKTADIKAEESDSVLRTVSSTVVLIRHCNNFCVYMRETISKQPWGKRVRIRTHRNKQIFWLLGKPNVRFAAGEPETNQIQPILDGLQEVLQTVLENQNQNQKPEVKTGEAKAPRNGDAKKKGSKPPSSAASEYSNSTQGSDRRPSNENRGSKINQVKEMVHPVRLEIIIRILDHKGIGGPLLLTDNIGSLFVTTDREDRHPSRTINPDKVTDHFQERSNSGPRAKKTAHLGGEVTTSAESKIVIRIGTVGIHVK